MPVTIACINCNEYGCESCNNTGYFDLTDCPKKYLDNDIFNYFHLADLMHKGLAPIAGGTLDQSAYFLNFYNIFNYENNLAEAELYK